MAEQGKDGRGTTGSSFSPSSEGAGNQEEYRGNLSRPKPQGIISFNKRAQIITVIGLAIVFGLIFYGVSQDTRQSGGGGGSDLIAKKKQETSLSSAKAIKDLIPEGPILPKRVETTQTDSAESQAPDWFSGDIKQEQQPNQQKQTPQVPPVVPPVTAPPPPPTTTQITPVKPPEDPDAARRKAGDAAAAQSNTSMSFGGSPARQNEKQNPPLQRDVDTAFEAQRDAFFQQAQNGIGTNYVRSTPTSPLSPYEIKAGWLIPAVLEHGINTSLQGMNTARVSQNVYDTVSGEHLLIPQGSRLIGKYDNTIGFAQDRVVVSWDRVIFPDGSSMNLESQKGVDERGYAGFRDKVNYHIGSILAAATLTSVLSSIPVYVQGSQAGSNTLTTTDASGNVLTIPNPRVIAAQNIASQIASLGQNITQKFLNIPPTVEIRPGYRFYVRVQKDLAFIRPYEFGATEQATGLVDANSNANSTNATATGSVGGNGNFSQPQASGNAGSAAGNRNR